MEIYFATEGLQQICNSQRDSDRRWGNQVAKKIRQRLAQLHAAETLEDMRQFGAAKAHELKGDRAGQIAVTAAGALRIIVIPAVEPAPRKPDGGLDWSKVTAITIVEITDYH